MTSAAKHADGSSAMSSTSLDDGLLAAVAEGRYHDPHSVLGQHVVAGPDVADRVTVIRTLRPLAKAVTAIVSTGARISLAHVGHGIWQGISVLGPEPYLIEASYDDGSRWVADDPYRFTPTVGELDLHLIAEGRHERLWDALGAHHREHEGVSGTAFTVWAPNAAAVRVVGDFNQWNGVSAAMRSMGRSGVWELFLPGIEPGAVYKFEVLGRDGQWRMKADPMARYAEVSPATGSVVVVSDYAWGDGEWMHARASSNPHSGPMSVYELHLGSLRPGLGYRDAADALIDYLVPLGYTHVEFLPLAEHPFGGSWGYQVTGYYAPTSRFGHPDDLRYLIDRLHGAGIGVLMDWVPGHFPKDEWALARFDGQALYEHPDPRRGEHQDWGTYIFDFGRSEVRNFLVAN
ncbi:MAG: GlgB N-terminal domain-containing protein, partial [Humibacter sp.]